MRKGGEALCEGEESVRRREAEEGKQKEGRNKITEV